MTEPNDRDRELAREVTLNAGISLGLETRLAQLLADVRAEVYQDVKQREELAYDRGKFDGGKTRLDDDDAWEELAKQEGAVEERAAIVGITDVRLADLAPEDSDSDELRHIKVQRSDELRRLVRVLESHSREERGT